MLAVTLGLVLQSTPVTFESPGIRLVNLIPALSKSVGVPMRVAKHLENDVVAIRAAGRPWSEVKANLAKVLNGEWRETDGEFFLGQSEAQRQAERDSRRAYMLRVLERRFAALAKNYSPAAWTQAEFNRWYSGFVQKPDPELNPASRRAANIEKNRSRPTGRLTARLLQSIKTSDLIPDDLDWEGNYFATDPFPMHRLLRIDSRDAYQKFAIENQMFFDRNGDDPESMATPLVGAIFRVYDQARVVSLSIDFYNAKGVGVDYFLDFDRIQNAVNFEVPRVRPELSKLLELVERVDADTDELAVETLRTKVRAVLGQARTLDPLALLGGADWVEISRERSKPMIAFLADSAAFVPMESGILPEKGPIRIDSGEWMLGSQVDMFLTRKHRFDRQALEVVAPYTVPTGRGSGWLGLPGILEKARLGYIASTGRFDWIENDALLNFEFDAAEEAAYFNAWLGAMTLDEQQRLIQSGKLVMTNLSPKAQEYFRKWIYLDGVITEKLDHRVNGVGFANLERDLVMRSQVTQEAGFIRYENSGGERVENRGETERNFASSLFEGGYGDKPESIVVAPASRTQLRLTLLKGELSVPGVLYSDWKPMGKPAKLTSTQLARLKRLYDEMSKEVPPVAVPVRPGTRQ